MINIFILTSAAFLREKSDEELETLFSNLTEEEYLFILLNWPLFTLRVVKIAQKMFEKPEFVSNQKIVLNYQKNYEFQN